MAIRPKKPFIQIQDRNLGDEWTDWQGHLKNGEQNADSGKRVFLGIMLTTILVVGIAVLSLWYMITPRLRQFHPQLPTIVGLGFLAFWGTLVLWFTLIVLSILTGKDLLLRFGKKEFSITFLVSVVLRLGLRLGISRDRLGNSFVKVSNTLIRMTASRVKPEKLLILLPRCLQKPLIQKITAFSKQLHIPVYTVGGGSKARQVVQKIKPRAIIGVACERDLLSGIRDIIGQIPVIGIPNVRPEGPCKNTSIDIQEFEKAIQTFLGPEIHLTLQERFLYKLTTPPPFGRSPKINAAERSIPPARRGNGQINQQSIL